jgi:hypothetical protein
MAIAAAFDTKRGRRHISPQKGDRAIASEAKACGIICP